MNIRCNRLCWGMLAGGLLLAGPSAAGTVSMPKKGAFEFLFCAAAQARTLTGGERHFVSQFASIVNVRTEPPGRPFDRTSGVCYGMYTNMGGRMGGSGVCEMVDADGDRFWMEYVGTADGKGGTYGSPWGSGKYAGMKLEGEYRVDPWPTSKDATFQICNPNHGTYELK